VSSARGIVSPDDHVVEPPDLWTSRLPARFADVAPRVIQRRGHGMVASGQYSIIEDPDGPIADVWVFEGELIGNPKTAAAVGFDLDDLSVDLIRFADMRPGCYQPAARLSDMDVAGIEASACFPNFFVRFCGQRFLSATDKDLARRCVEAYNDFQIDEWCGDSKGRLIPLGILPLWDPSLCVAEIERSSARGMRAFCFSELPVNLGLPSIHTGAWDGVFAACQAADVPLMMHIGSGSRMPTSSPDAPHAVISTLGAVNSATSMIDWLFSAKLVEFPTLRLGLAECNAGWIPYFLHRADEVYESRRAWGGVNKLLKEPPSTYYYGRIFCSTFSADPVAFRNIDLAGEDNILFETDYPHNDTNWPTSADVAASVTAGLDPVVADKVLRTNALRLFGLDPNWTASSA
jgi:predicted TIM-barrel fold metal-dependent hydrolase